MLGAVIGDIVGSRFEWNDHRSKDFELLTPDCFFTDDSVMTLAIADALLDWRSEGGDLGARTIERMRSVGQPYPNCGYGGKFAIWMYAANPQPYDSYGNGAAMRVSACGYLANSLGDAKHLSRAVTEVTHNHPEGIKGAEATAVCVFAALNGWKMDEIRAHVHENYYPLNRTLDEIRPVYLFNETCQETVPEAITAFIESTDFEDAIRNAISIGGDSDTVAAITCGIAGAYYGIPASIREQALTYLDERLLSIVNRFEAAYPTRTD